ncbi:hypothetical protein LUW77_14960 [Streptomyces radiopugnans]|nr:hypothetical protein LUW77_14960 [Streptomyces radiopugnans]
MTARATKTPPDDVTAAEQEAAEAEQLLTALEERVRDGDDTVTADQLASTRELGRFARLRAEAARRKAERAAEAARLDAVAALADEIRAADTDRTALAEAVDRLTTALRDVVTLAEEHNQQLAQWRNRAMQIGVQPGPTGHRLGPKTAGMRLVSDRGLSVDDVEFAPVPTGSLISAAVHRATFPRDTVRHQGKTLWARCPDWTNGHSRPINLRSALPATAKGGA